MEFSAFGTSSLFYDHALVKYKDKYYDPSYGTGPYDSLEDWKNTNVVAFGAMLCDPAPGEQFCTITSLNKIIWVEKLNDETEMMHETIVDYP